MVPPPMTLERPVTVLMACAFLQAGKVVRDEHFGLLHTDMISNFSELMLSAH